MYRSRKEPLSTGVYLTSHGCSTKAHPFLYLADFLFRHPFTLAIDSLLFRHLQPGTQEHRLAEQPLYLPGIAPPEPGKGTVAGPLTPGQIDETRIPPGHHLYAACAHYPVGHIPHEQPEQHPGVMRVLAHAVKVTIEVAYIQLPGYLPEMEERGREYLCHTVCIL